MEIITIDTPALGDRSYIVVVVDGDAAAVIDPQRDIDEVDVRQTRKDKLDIDVQPASAIDASSVACARSAPVALTTLARLCLDPGRPVLGLAGPVGRGLATERGATNA